MMEQSSLDNGHSYRAFLPVFPRPRHDQPVNSANGWASRFDQVHSGLWLTAPGPFPSLDAFAAEARARAEKRLDILSVMGAGSHIIPQRDRDLLAMIEKGGRQALWIRSPHILSVPYAMHSMPAWDTEAEKPKVALASYHASMRYFRLAQVSADPFGCFVYLYRALESILDELHPYERGGQKQWFENAMTVALAKCHEHAREGLAEHATVEKFVEFVYEEIRNGLFHSKPSKQPVMPLDPNATVRVREASRLVSLVVVELLKDYLPIGRGARINSDLDMHESSQLPESLQGLSLLVEGIGRGHLILPVRPERHAQGLGHLLIADSIPAEQIPDGPIIGAQVMTSNGPGPRVVFDGRIDGNTLDELTVEVLMAVDFELGHRTAGWLPKAGVQVAPRLN